MQKSGITYLPGNVELTGDDNFLPAYKLQAQDGIAVKCEEVLENGLLDEFSLIAKVRLDKSLKKANILTIMNKDAVDLSVNMSLTETGITVHFECSNILADFAVNLKDLGEWHKLGIVITTKAIQLTYDGQLVAEGFVPESEACMFMCRDREIHIARNNDGPVSTLNYIVY